MTPLAWAQPGPKPMVFLEMAGKDEALLMTSGYSVVVVVVGHVAAFWWCTVMSYLLQCPGYLCWLI